LLFRQVAPERQSALSATVTADPTARLPIPRTLLLWLTVGLAGAVLFTITYVIEGATRPHYSAWQQAISALSLGPGGWLQQVNFVVFGACTLCMAFAWRKALKGNVYGILYPLIRGIEAFALIMVGFFSQDPARGYPPGTTLAAPTLHGEIHIIGAYVIVGAMACGLFVIAGRFARDPQWRGWAAFSVICGVLTLTFMAFFGAAQNPQSMFADSAGLFERLATNIETIWEVALLVRLWAGTGFLRSTEGVS
jgi:hypothetical membrane protein